jgi:energy-coupling factor transport system permease protein
VIRPGAALALLAALAAGALLADHVIGAVAVALVLLAVCLRAPRSRRRLYLVGTAVSAVALFVLTPFVETLGSHPLWTGPIIPVLGQLDVTSEELTSAALNAVRLLAVGLAFAAYALLLDHDRLLQAARFARPAALATRLMPALERDAAGFVDSLRGRGVEVTGLRGHAALLSPLLASSLERGLNLAEAMEARGYGRAGRTSVPRPRWGALDYGALGLAAIVLAVGAMWL